MHGRPPPRRKRCSQRQHSNALLCADRLQGTAARDTELRQGPAPPALLTTHVLLHHQTAANYPPSQQCHCASPSQIFARMRRQNRPISIATEPYHTSVAHRPLRTSFRCKKRSSRATTCPLHPSAPAHSPHPPWRKDLPRNAQIRLLATASRLQHHRARVALRDRTKRQPAAPCLRSRVAVWPIPSAMSAAKFDGDDTEDESR